LQKQATKSEKKILIFEYAKNVSELMEVADLIITKPGGMTTSESLAKGLPMVIVNPLPGQEMRNTDFLIQKGIAIRVDDATDLGEEVELLFRSPERMLSMSEAAYKNSKPRATEKICNLILSSEQS
ncbi:MAG: galactosyldiacylglycerol synthase, partial [Candidatus Omnitrophica bacterium]|nr:galactosyldiacylglycerol synthase [Candidatus Omnitrophota bacterium]